MTRLSHNVIVGKVVSVTPRYVPAADGVGLPTIQTVVRVRVGDALKGRPGGWVTVRVPGGAIGDERLVVEEAPTFRRGETLPGVPRREGPGGRLAAGQGRGRRRPRAAVGRESGCREGARAGRRRRRREHARDSDPVA